jgi:hypothetical protein
VKKVIENNEEAVGEKRRKSFLLLFDFFYFSFFVFVFVFFFFSSPPLFLAFRLWPAVAEDNSAKQNASRL